MRSFKSNENFHKKEGGSYYVVLANEASSVTLYKVASSSWLSHYPEHSFYCTPYSQRENVTGEAECG